MSHRRALSAVSVAVLPFVSWLVVGLAVLASPRAVASPCLVLGDANEDDQRDVADAVFILQHLFLGGPVPSCPTFADVNADRALDLSDAVHLLEHLFLGGGPPLHPAVECCCAEQCALLDWPLDCGGHWECVCGECAPVCDAETCGDGVCDVEGGETVDSCPEDCSREDMRPVCGIIGSRSEGWYEPATHDRIRFANCAESQAVCRACGSRSEGWYDSRTGELIAWADCDCEAE